MRRCSLVVLTLTALFFGLICNIPPATKAATQSYSVTDLGILPATLMSQGVALNDAGQVTGFSYKAFFDHPRGFFYSGGQLLDIGTLGGDEMRPAAVNSAGDVVGTSQGKDAFLYHNGVLQPLGTLPGDAFSAASDINDKGIIVGSSSGATSTDIPGPRHAFVYRDGVMQDLGAPSGFTDDIYAIGINDLGQILCIAGRDATEHAFLYYNGSFHDLFSLSETGVVSFDLKINNDGIISGSTNTGKAFVYRDGTFTFVGTLGGDSERAHGLNDAEEVVGRATVPNSTTFHAFLYSDGVTKDLNDLIPADSGCELNAAYDINNAGQITGFGTINGETHAFLLTPVATNSPFIVTEGTTAHAVAVDSVTMLRDPFPVLNTQNLSADHRTRVTLFVRNILLSAGEDASVLHVSAQDSQQRTFPVVIEAASRVAATEDLSQVVILLPDTPEDVTELRFTLTYRNLASNEAYVDISR